MADNEVNEVNEEALGFSMNMTLHPANKTVVGLVAYGDKPQIIVTISLSEDEEIGEVVHAEVEGWGIGNRLEDATGVANFLSLCAETILNENDLRGRVVVDDD